MTIADRVCHHKVTSVPVESPMRPAHKPSFIFAGVATCALLIAGCSGSDVEPGRFTIGGTVTGLTGGNVVLQNNGIDTLSVASDGGFTFATPLTDGDPYEVTILAQPAAPRQVCLVGNGAGRLPGGSVINVDIDCFPALALSATPAIDRFDVRWNAGDFAAGTTFNLCRAAAPIDAGVANCAAHPGGLLIPAAESPYLTPALDLDTAYWFLLEAVHPGGLRTTSTMLARSIPTGFDGPFAELNDTGIDWCGNDTSNIASQSAATLPQRTAGCNQTAASHPGQDGHLGRDAAARAGILIKTGAGIAGFDFTRICINGEAAGTGACPVTPVIGQNPTSWGCVRDNVTGLMWEVKPLAINLVRSLSHSYTWFDPAAAANQGVQDGGFCAAGAACADPAFGNDTHAYVQAVNASGLCGVDDWRLPAVDELHSISHQGRINPALPQGAFPGATGEIYWSGTPVAGFPGEAWFVDFRTGNDGWDNKGSAYRVRVVSGLAWAPATAADIPSASAACDAGLAETAPSTDFTAVGDGSIVRHLPTGLEWQRCAVGQEWDGAGCAGASTIHDWQEALALADAEPGWRLPNINELRTIIERCRISPAINLEVFPDAPGAAFFSSSPSAANPDQAWVVHFLSGNDNRIRRITSAQVRLVRDAQ